MESVYSAVLSLLALASKSGRLAGVAYWSLAETPAEEAD